MNYKVGSQSALIPQSTSLRPVFMAGILLPATFYLLRYPWPPSRRVPASGKPVWFTASDTAVRHVFFDDNIHCKVHDSIVAVPCPVEAHRTRITGPRANRGRMVGRLNPGPNRRAKSVIQGQWLP